LPEEIKIATLFLHELDERLVSIGSVAVKLSDEAELKRYGWYRIATTGNKLKMFPRAASKSFKGIGV